MKRTLTIIIFLTSLSSFGQDSILGEYRYWFIVHGYQLQINHDQTFKLKQTGSIIDPPEWTGNWSTKADTLILDFTIDSMGIRKHIITSEYLLRTNLEIPDSAMPLYFPQYYYKFSGYFENGRIKCQANWESISYGNNIPTKEGEWKFYYPNGGLQRIEVYKNNLRHGNFVFYDLRGFCEKIERWKKGKLKKIKDCP
tara:strand:- start:35 stop:625 length:591 start_codon:yes stop_codon:yes gene_type:complete